MNLGVPLETFLSEKRVALVPATVKSLIKLGHIVRVANNAGSAAGYPDDSYVEVGGVIVSQEEALMSDVVLKVQPPTSSEITLMRSGSVLIGMLNPFDKDLLGSMIHRGLQCFALEAIPRITRAQTMDVLSSQSNVAGYRAVLLATQFYQSFLPMLMTAAGTVKAARVLILGVGVAGLQAIATAKRLGAIVEATDVRPAVKEQVTSLGAKFIDVPFETDEEAQVASGTGGYARSMPPEWLARQAKEVAKHLAKADIVITTALIPGKPAPTLITKSMVESMRPGSVIVDMAAGKGSASNNAVGGNCELSSPNQVIQHNGVYIVGETNLPSLMARDASALYSKNMESFLSLLTSTECSFKIPEDDEIINACHMNKVFMKQGD
jgi:NAD(P) transhydrogenase subunit alpha